MTKRNYSDELNKIVGKFNKPIVDDLKDSIDGICKYYQLTKKDLCELCALDETNLDTFMSCDDADCLLDLRTISLLTLLSNGNIHTLSDTPDGKMLNEVNRIVKDYHDKKYPPVKTGWDEKIKEMLDLFGVKNLDDMDHILDAVKSVRNAIDEFELSEADESDKDTCRCGGKCNCSDKHSDETDTHDKKHEKVYVDSDGNFHSQEPFTSENSKGNFRGTYFDSSTMDKPKEFTFNGNFGKIFPDIMDFVAKKFF